MLRNIRCVMTLALALLYGQDALAQFNNAWVEFQNQTATRLVATPALGVSDPEEKDYAWGDVDNDGDVDLVCVRKQPFTSPGRQPNVLFMNEDGVLVDRTALYASDSDVSGDQGFLTPTNDRDVVLADFNGDGWLDIATAVTISDGLPKPISHPRIYVNKGAVSGVWQGFRFEAARSPQLYVLKTDGTPDFTKPSPGRFCSIAAGDADGDGDADLFLGDYDSSGAGGSPEPPGLDINDRLWINDGNGFFTDSYQTRMTAQMLNSAFSTSVAIEDMNGDGLQDVVKDTALNAPQYVGIAYNRNPNDGIFDIFDTPHTFAPYFVSVGELNNDHRLDMVVTDDDDDRYRLNQGNDALERVIWSGAFTFAFPAGAGYGDDGFGSQSVIADLDRDGWNDVLISDVDVDAAGCNRRMHVYHNLGNPPDVTLREEAQQAGVSGWKGAVGLTSADLTGVFNVAAFDLDSDGDQDLVLGRCTGTSVWVNTLCRIRRYGTAAPNSTGLPARLSWTGTASLGQNDLVLRVSGLPANASGIFLFGEVGVEPCVPDGNGFRCVAGPLKRTGTLPATANGSGVAAASVNFNSPIFAGVTPGSVRYVQFRYRDPAGGFNYTDAFDMRLCR